MLDLELLPRALHWLRVRDGKKQCEVAAEAGVSPSMLSGYEKGSRTPSLESLAKVLHALGASLSDLESVLLSLAEEDRSGNRPASEARLTAGPAAGANDPYPLPGELLRTSSLAEPGASLPRHGTVARPGAPELGETLERELDREAVELLRSIKKWLQADRDED